MVNYMENDKQIVLDKLYEIIELGIQSIESLMKMNKFIAQKYSENVSNDSRK